MITVLSKIIIAKHDVNETPDFVSQDAIVLGLIKGKPFVSITVEQDIADTHLGVSPLDLIGKYETSLLDIDPAMSTRLAAIRGKNVSLLCDPQGDISSDNPQVLIKNFILNYELELNIGNESTVQLYGLKPASKEEDVFEYLQEGQVPGQGYRLDAHIRDGHPELYYDKSEIDNKIDTHVEDGHPELYYDKEEVDNKISHKLDAHEIPDDTTNLNATTARHGLLPKLSGNDNDCLTGAGNWQKRGLFWMPELTPPEINNFTWINQQQTQVIDANGAKILYRAAPGTGQDRWSFLCKPISSQLFDVIIGVEALFIINLYQSFGIVLYNNVNGRILSLHFGNYSPGKIELCRFTNVNTWNSTIQYWTTIGFAHLLFLRMIQTQAERRCFFSANGITWNFLLTISNTEWLTPTHVGFGINPYNGNHSMSATFVHWKE